MLHLRWPRRGLLHRHGIDGFVGFLGGWLSLTKFQALTKSKLCWTATRGGRFRPFQTFAFRCFHIVHSTVANVLTYALLKRGEFMSITFAREPAAHFSGSRL